MITFTIPGKPQPKQRPRVLKNGHSYTPKETLLYEELVVESAQKSKLLPQSPLTTPLKMIIWACMPIPKSWNKGKQEAARRGELYPTSRPDIDNLAKIVMDALNGIAYVDDAQIVQLVINKVYSEHPCMEVLIDEMN